MLYWASSSQQALVKPASPCFVAAQAGDNCPPKNEKRELYDLSKDPHEEKNIYDADYGISKNLETKLEKWIETTKPDYEESAKVEMDKDASDRLKALGYIQ